MMFVTNTPKSFLLIIAIFLMLFLVSCGKEKKEIRESKTSGETETAQELEQSDSTDNIYQAVEDSNQIFDLGTPEKALDYYINALRKGDVDLVYKVYANTDNFYLPGPINIADYTITKKILFDEEAVNSWNTKGIQPPAQFGDIELQVEEFYPESDSGYMFSYWLRLYDGQWKIYAHAGWDQADELPIDLPDDL
jgi:uncharacterized protein YpmS